MALNRGPLVVQSAGVHPLTPRQVDQACSDGALVVDVRTELQFDEAHIPRSVSITALRAGFGSKLAWLVEPGQSVVLVGRDDEDARQAAVLAESVGITRLAGFLHGGMTSWREERRPVERIERIGIPELRERADELQILDVRERDEWDAGHIPGSVHVPYHDIHGLPDGDRLGAADRGHLQLRPARGAGGEPAAPPRRARGAARGGRRRAALG